MCKSWSRSDNARWKIGPWKKLFANYQFWMSGCRSPKLRVAEFGQCIFKHVQQSIANAENCNVERFKSEALLRWIEKLSKARLPGRWLMRRRHVQQCIKVQVIHNVESKVVESRERFVVLQTSKETWNGFHATIDNLTSASERDVCQEFDDRLSMKRDVSGSKSLSENCVM